MKIILFALLVFSGINHAADITHTQTGNTVTITVDIAADVASADAAGYSQGFNDGAASVDTQSFYDQGYSDGYAAGYSDGQANQPPAAPPPPPPPASAADIGVLFIGDSNMIGFNSGGSLPDVTAQNIYQYPGSLEQLQGPSRLSHPDTRGHVGPGVSFLQTMATRYPNNRVVGIGGGFGGTGLSTGDWQQSNGEYPYAYAQAVVRTRAFLADNPDNRLAAIVIQIGTNDTGLTGNNNGFDQAQFESAMDDLVANLRGGDFYPNDYHADFADIPIIFLEFPESVDAGTSAQIRAALENFPTRYTDAIFIDSNGMANSDYYHFAASAQISLGTMAAEAFALVD